MLYSYKNQFPNLLPHRIRLSDGRTRTDPTTFTLEEILDAGYKPVGEPPLVNEHQTLSWDGNNWLVTDLTQEQIELNNKGKLEQVFYAFKEKMQMRLDAFAKSRGYDNILSACTYATDLDPVYSKEGQHCVKLRGQSWAALYAILKDIETEVRPIPASFEELEPELPVLDWSELAES